MNKLFLILLLFYSALASGQVQNLPLNFIYNQRVEQFAVQNDEVISIKPFNRQFLSQKVYDEVYADSNDYRHKFGLKLYKENLLNVNENDVKLVADPLFNFVYGQSSVGDSTHRLLTNTRGVRVAGDITSKFSFETRYYETQIFYPEFLDSIATARGIAFGKGRAKSFHGGGFDVGTAMGYVSFAATNWMNIQFGNTNQFIGNGYRSLLLSDNSLNYPNLTFQLKLAQGKIRYFNTNAWLQSLERIPASSTPESQFKSRDGSFRYLVFHPVKQLEIGFFEGVIYKTYHDSIGEMSPNYSFYIPVIGVASFIKKGSKDNKVLLGVNANYRFGKKVLLFGQFAKDENGIAYQLGAKYFDAFGLKNSWLHIEYNHVDPFVYSMSSSNYLQTYSNSNQELAYALGAGTDEFLSKIYLPFHRFYGMLSVFVANKTRYNGGVYGEDIFQFNDIELLSKQKVTWNYSSVEVGCNLNIQTRMNVFANYTLRNEAGKGWRDNEAFWQVGLRTMLNNYYVER